MLLWKFVTREVPGEPCVHGGRLYVGGGDFFMYCLSLDGKELWRFKTRGYVWHQNIMVGRNVVFGSWDCNLYCVDGETGELVWKFNTGGSPCPVPPTYEGYEMQMKIPEAEIREERKKTYELEFVEQKESSSSFYRTGSEYQASNQYRERGKYQIDSDNEAF